MAFWYQRSILAWVLLPLSLIFWLITQCRRGLFSLGILKSYQAPKPVLIVGNLSVGGNGKTPVVIWLVQKLQQQGIRVGVISRGYGSQAKSYPFFVTPQTDPIEGGDEPVLIAKRTQAPVVISPNRQQAIELLLKTQDCDFIIADDGLQHYALQRNLEVVVVDVKRGFGNGFLLPAGPLRELPSRLKSVDFVVGNGGANAYCDAQMQLVAQNAMNLVTGETRPLNTFSEAVAMAAIGNPPRFFKMLQEFGIQLRNTQSFRDHQRFDETELDTLSAGLPLLMTEKDAVKCLGFAKENWWYVPVTTDIQAVADNSKLAELWQKIGHLLGRELPWKN